jgi:hypothetical protein
MAVVMIGVDPPKASHTAVVIGAAEEPLGELRARASAAQAEKLGCVGGSVAGAQRQLMQTWLWGSMPANSQMISDRGVGKGRDPGRGVVIMMLPAADAGDPVICGGGAAGALAGGYVPALMGAIGVAAAVRRGDRLASRWRR